MPSWDIVTVGGGIGAAAFAKAMAERGARVLVVEREREFRDRVRGEALAPWGVAELDALGLLDAVGPAIADQLHTGRMFVDGEQVAERAFEPTTLPRRNWLAFYHPAAQQACLDAAGRAGAEVLRGARITAIHAGTAPDVILERDGRRETISARMIVAADGRGSAARALPGFQTCRDPDNLLFSGVYVENIGLAHGCFYQFCDPSRGRMAFVFPQRGGRARCYVGWNQMTAVPRLQGESSFARFRAEAEDIGVPREALSDARMAGPLATFDGADTWVDHAYRDGVALLGDAAATSDPTWGQGMSLTLRGAHLLRDALAGTGDWDAAGHAYARELRRVYEVVHRADGWYTTLFMDVGPRADALRERAFPKLAEDPTRMVDVPNSGPEAACDETARRRFFGEE